MHAVPPSATLVLAPGLPLRDGLCAAFTGVLAHAAAQLERAATDPAKAIHEYRKSIRRARALVRLVRPLVKRRRYERLDGALREAVRATSSVRDAEVLGETIDELPSTADLAPAIEAAHALATAEQTDATAILARGVAQLAVLPARFAKALPARLQRADIERALQASYRRARHRCREALASRGDEEIHDWRKRTKELRYQLEMLEPTDADEHQPHESLLGDVAKGLGTVTDLMVLRTTVRAHASQLGTTHTEALVAALDALIPARFAPLAMQAGPYFDTRPRDYARTVLAPSVPESLMTRAHS